MLQDMHREASLLEKLGLSQKSLFSLFLASLGGAIAGIVVSIIVNTALVELTVNPFFSVYFAFLSVSVGCLILWRVVNREVPDPDNVYQKQLATLAYLVILSGFFAFLLPQSWFIQLNPLLKIPVYSILGISVAFSLSFTLVDVLNLIFGLFQSTASRSIVQSVSQVRLVVFATILMGGTFGTIFGFADVEDAVTSSMELAMMREENYCYPLGGLLGAMVVIVFT
ncbi:uncharacterized protein LOC128883087 isoform X2 [Hylaeus volcanicus]|uniref:uncharacterized protein LOC128883087 isoform X2 n=1 Tax=Hylaeus volcanicus TaxID=313075 RepID=UPI0023B8389B|nr:uncharacterized protein LOC128883087 isoform X2 [Hylaeus volcanicus]